MAAIANRNCRNMVQHVLLPVNIHFHWNLFIFEFLTIFFNFYIDSHFENFKNKEHNFERWSILCQVSKASAVWSEFKKMCTLVTMVTTAIFNFFNPSKVATHKRWIFLHNFMKLNERNPKILKSPVFVSMATAANLSNRFRFFWLISFH